MNQALVHKKWNKVITTVVLTITGSTLTILHLVLSLLSLNNMIEALLYLGFGYVVGKKVQGSNWLWGLLLALPAILLILYRIVYAYTLNGSIGFEPFLTLILLPVSACLGMYLRIRHHYHKQNLIDEHVLND